MKKGFERARFVLWLVLVVVLFMAMFSVWRSMFSDTLQTALYMARLQMTDRANTYKQEWVLQGRPAHLQIEQAEIPMQHGWIFPKIDQGVDCEKVLFLLYPDRKVLDWLPKVTATHRVHGYLCHYQYGDVVQIDVELKDRYFAIDASFLVR
ncbi:MSHA biogenesis protein MshF [Vibrio tarriae]|uniref:MSHA biogenesis protein MshF n=1 Tax=Vibrio tarriae TaxID=2014742 RepID=UPI000DE3C6E9|nr:MSHA biogenesis protein MshF [Vibrio tarriae]QEO44407.1 MSHA biogenesis protein MshF [Vibrio cholerae]RBM35522.1 MSHA biogenesis protein MshF [Vibrio tarriae]RBM54220.1 MSHA biogenesis protein MshF [Vibrio tarriae]